MTPIASKKCTILWCLPFLLLTSPSIALDQESFKWVEIKELDDSIRCEINNNTDKQEVFAFPGRGPIVFETRRGEEYGYVVTSIVVHDCRTGKTFHIYCWDFERESKMDMRGVEPQYSVPTYTDMGIVRVEVMMKGKIDGHILFDAKKPSLQYVPFEK